MKHLIYILVITSFIFRPYKLLGQMTLLDAKEYAIKNHYNIANSILEYDKVLYQKKEYLSAGLPEANITASFNQFFNLPVQVLPISFFNPTAPEDEILAFRAGTEFNTNASFQVNQLLFDGSYFVGIQASKILIELQRQQKTRTKEEVIFAVIDAYHIAAIAQENLSFVDSIYQLTAKLEENQKRVLKLGLITQEEVNQMTFAVSSSKNAFENASMQYLNAMALLKYSMNYPQDSVLKLANSLSELDSKSSQISLGSIENNSLLPLLQTQIKLSQCNVKNNKARFLPSLSAYFQQSYNAYRTSFDFFEDKPWYSQTNWGIQMKIPVFSSGKGIAVVKKSKIKLMQDENNYELTKQGLKLQEFQLKNTLKSAINKRELQKENCELAEKIYKNALKKEKIGDGNNFVVTQKLNQLMITQAEYIGSLIEVYKTKLELDKLYNKLTLK